MIAEVDATLVLWGSNIAEHRRRRDLTQTELGQLVGVHFTTVSKWELGKVEPTRHHKAAVAKALRTTTARLFP